ncbi:MAG: CpXC domain-containing protein [Elusimicrobiota bacterium]|jgi:hypothetical protein
MSTYNDIDITCEQCGEEFQGTVWTAVHAGQDPELKELLLGGELNLIMCPECSYVTYQDHFVLYQDPQAELVAYIYPLSQKEQAEELRVMMIEGFRHAQLVYAEKNRIPYDPILLFGLESLIEMMDHEEELAEQSQIAEYICKENAIPFVKLRPSQARQKDLVRVIPSGDSPASTNRESVLAGINRLLKINPALDVYGRLRERIQADPKWPIE